MKNRIKYKFRNILLRKKRKSALINRIEQLERELHSLRIDGNPWPGRYPYPPPLDWIDERLRNELIVQMELLRKQHTSPYSFLNSFRFILPKRYREEFTAEIEAIYIELEEKSVNPIEKYWSLSLHILTIAWYSFRLRVDAYFQSDSQTEKND